MSKPEDFIIENGVLKKYVGTDAAVVILDGITEIGEYAFKDCRSLESAKILDKVVKIRTSAFANCTGLKSIEIPNSVTAIWDNVFEGCPNLTSVTIPDSVREFGSDIFFDCPKVTVYCSENSAALDKYVILEKETAPKAEPINDSLDKAIVSAATPTATPAAGNEAKSNSNLLPIIAAGAVGLAVGAVTIIILGKKK